MVSRRNYITIILLMGIIFFLFFFMGAAKDQWNDYQNNSYIEEKGRLPTAESAWKGKVEGAKGANGSGERALQEGAIEKLRNYVIYLGDLDLDAEGDTIQQWCTYSKRIVQDCGSLADWAGLKEETPEVLLINPDYLKAGTDSKLLKDLVKRGVSMIFCRLPEPEVLEKDRQLRELLRIQKIAADSWQLEGIKLFGGFLLGGEVHYIAAGPEDEKKQDMDLEVPWYQLSSATKTYMVGVLEEEQMDTVKNEQLPALIWRASYEEAKVFAINGTFLEDVSGVGILSAMLAELHSYELYPVVNAQSLALINSPDLTSENEEQVEQIYSRSTRQLLRDVVFPGLAATSEVLAFPMTCLMTVKINGAASGQPMVKDLEYYLKYLNELKAEMGISLLAGDEEALVDRAEEISGLLTENKLSYQYGVLYAEEEKLGEAAALLGEKKDIPALQSVNTVISESTGDYDLLDYLDSTTTLQGKTQDGVRHTYMDDFRLRALETGLGYSNIFLDLKQVVYPQTEADHWENLSVEFTSSLNTYWKPFRSFDTMVLSESDRRVRKFLALDYADSRSGDTIELEISGLEEEAWFVLRTHGEVIEQVKGASWEKMERDAYLLTVTESQVVITLKQEPRPYYYEE